MSENKPKKSNALTLELTPEDSGRDIYAHRSTADLLTDDQETPDVDPNEEHDRATPPWTPDTAGSLRELAGQACMHAGPCSCPKSAPGLWVSQAELDQLVKIGVERNDLRDEVAKLKSDLEEAKKGRRDAEDALATADAQWFCQALDMRAELVLAKVRLERVLEGEQGPRAPWLNEARDAIKKVLASLPISKEGGAK